MFPIFEKSEVFCRSACPAIAFGDGGLSRHSLLQQQCNYWKNIISPQWEQSISFYDSFFTAVKNDYCPKFCETFML